MRYMMRNAVEWVVQLGLALTVALVHLELREALRRQSREAAAAPGLQSASGRRLRRMFWVR
jgi:endonuclease/exonuclease/phosphatase family metal-dependent hydrolase